MWDEEVGGVVELDEEVVGVVELYEEVVGVLVLDEEVWCVVRPTWEPQRKTFTCDHISKG